ncbi:MAG: VWA domain-containing protein [Saprospiraceae bacterium]|nr:VWA domain-containing protein [Saprospiraceae bacterium]
MSDLSRWKLVLGALSDQDNTVKFNKEQQDVENLLEEIYGNHGKEGRGRSTRKIKNWLDGIRLNFPSEVVQIMQEDALERQGIKEMLLEPELLEKIEPSIELVASILQLQNLLPERTISTARALVFKLVTEIERKLTPSLQFAVQRAIKRHSKPTSPSNSNMDWKKTIYKNLKNYRPELNTIIPDRWFGYKKGYKLPQVFILVDTSESMIHSMIYAAIMGSVLAFMKTIKTHLIFFNTEVTDLTDAYLDPVDILFSVPCGGGTDIALALEYTRQQIKIPNQSLIFLISDLYEGGNRNDLIQICNQLVDQNSKLICLLSLSNDGKPDYDIQLAKTISGLNIPCFACPPEQFPELITNHLNAVQV